jgi:hypothetical protein
MSHSDLTAADLLQRLGITVSSDQGSGWGWSMQTERLVRPQVTGFASRAEATEAALAWMLEKAWRGVLCPIMHAPVGDDHAAPEEDESLLTPWLSAISPELLAAG